jgi:hypothetical protein
MTLNLASTRLIPARGTKVGMPPPARLKTVASV